MELILPPSATFSILGIRISILLLLEIVVCKIVHGPSSYITKTFHLREKKKEKEKLLLLQLSDITH